jgi:hypothetical protein
MASKKKLDVAKLAILAVIVVCLVLVIVGVCIDWVSNTTTTSSLIGGGSTTNNYPLNEENFAKADNYGTMVAFAYTTLALAAVCVLAYAASVLLNNKIVNYVTLVVGILLIVSAVVSIILSFVFCSGLANGGFSSSVISASSTTSPAAGAWLVAVFGVVGGAATVVGSLKK